MERNFLQSNSSQSAVPGPAAPASSGKVSEMQVPGTYPAYWIGNSWGEPRQSVF